jgi:hypothetical protein
MTVRAEVNSPGTKTSDEFFCDLSRCLVRHCSAESEDLQVAQPVTARINARQMSFFIDPLMSQSDQLIDFIGAG